MKPNTNSGHNRPRRPRRSSGNNNRRNHHTNPNKHWESLGPNVRIRGSAHQIYDKYIALASDAKRNGDRVLVENLMQHAEHYARIMNRQQAQQQARHQSSSSEQDTAENEAANEAMNGSDNAATHEEDGNAGSQADTLQKRSRRKQRVVSDTENSIADAAEDSVIVTSLADNAGEPAEDDSDDTDDVEAEDGAIVEDLTPKLTLLNTEADDIE